VNLKKKMKSAITGALFRAAYQKCSGYRGPANSVSSGQRHTRGGQKRLSCVFVLFGNVKTFDDGPPRGARADVILYTFNEPEEERLTLFVGAGEDTTKEFNLIV